MHNGQVAFKDLQAICGTCGVKLVWCQTKQLASVAQQLADYQRLKETLDSVQH